jgi:predicted Zn-dependent peptidase
MSFSSTRIIFNEVLDNSLWGDRSLGLFVIGRRENISRFDRMDLLSCLERAYTPERSCLVVIGPVEAEVLWAMAEWRLGGWTAGNGHPLCPSAPVEVDPRILSIPQKSSRVDLLFGFPVPSATAPERWTLEILSDILGAGFRSRLFLALREGRNLAYLVRAFPVVYSRSGYIGVQVNCAAGDAAEVCKVVGAELERLRREGTQAEEVERAKAGKRMVLLDTLDNNGSYLQLLGRRALQGEDFDPERELAYCQQVSGEEVHGVAHRCLRFDRAGVVARGPDIGELQKLVPADDAMERMAVPLGSGNDDHRE